MQVFVGDTVLEYLVRVIVELHAQPNTRRHVLSGSLRCPEGDGRVVRAMEAQCTYSRAKRLKQPV